MATEPCAKCAMPRMPNTTVRPSAIMTYTDPMARPFSICCRISVIMGLPVVVSERWPGRLTYLRRLRRNCKYSAGSDGRSDT